MDDQPPKYRREFWKSPHHAWLAILTLGLGFISAQELYLLLGAGAYALGWVYLPDLGFFRRWVDKRREAARQKSDASALAEFFRRREAILDGLSPHRRERYQTLAGVCRDIERVILENQRHASESAEDPRLRRLDDLMWTFLRLLSLEESLDRFLEIEQREKLPQLMSDVEQEATNLSAEIEQLKKAGRTAYADQKQRLLDSCLERREVLRKRLHRFEQAQVNLALVASEQDRLDHQIKLIRADAIAAKNAQAFSARIDATVEHLNQTNQWLTQLAEFKDLVGDMPSTDVRVGYDASKPPVLGHAGQPPRVLPREKQKAQR